MALSVHRPSKIYSYILQAIWGSLDKPNLRVADRSVEYKVHVRDKWQPSVSPSVRFTRCWETEAKWQELTNLIWRWKRTFVTQYTYIYSLYFCWLWVFCMETYIYPFARVSQNGFFPLIAPVLTPLASFLVLPQISIKSLPSWRDHVFRYSLLVPRLSTHTLLNDLKFVLSFCPAWGSCK